MAKDSKKIRKKVNDQKKIVKPTREEKLASALKKNIKLRKENKNNC